MSATIQTFGIRHHGPGSARSLIHALNAFQPDAILVEGPPDAENVLHFLLDEQMAPPVALLIYATESPRLAAYYPMTFFSPEYQAIRYALQRGLTLRLMDLPQSIGLEKFVRPALEQLEEARATAEKEMQIPQPLPNVVEMVDAPENDEEPSAEDAEATQKRIQQDPLSELARAAGYADGERWWDHMIEQRKNHQEIFDAVLEAMTELRSEYTITMLNPEQEAMREAYMRTVIRDAESSGHERIAVVCGAWHAPVLQNMPPNSDEEDAALLADVETISVASTWIPWTNSRLSFNSGYGAGIHSPGWYQFLWENAESDIAAGWLTRIAQLLRETGQNASPAEVIDAVRLAETLATIRGRPLPDLHDMNEAALSVLCRGNPAPMAMIQKRLTIGDAIGVVPEGTPMVPLQRDLGHQQMRLNLRQESYETTLSLDQRREQHLEQSYLLHRLNVLGVQWGQTVDVSEFAGTYKEVWKLNWTPELTIRLIEKSAWGNTVEEAAIAFAINEAESAKDLPALTKLVNQTLLANLPAAVEKLVKNLRDRATLTRDLIELMEALPPLAEVMVYSDVRNTHDDIVRDVIDGFLRWIRYDLPVYCNHIDDTAARKIKKPIVECHSAIHLLADDTFSAPWYATLSTIFMQTNVNGIISGLCGRLLLDDRHIEMQDVLQHFRQISSMRNDAEHVAGFLEGFLSDKGLILVHDDQLLPLMDEWIVSLDNTTFEALLPLLRRTFMTFHEPELRQIARRVTRLSEVNAKHEMMSSAPLIDHEHSAAVLDTLADLLGPPVKDKDTNDEH